MTDAAGRERRPRVQVSVFAKFVAIMVAMAISLLVIVTAFFWMIIGPTLTRSIERLLEEYADAIAATSPDLERAKQLAAQLDRLGETIHLQVRYEGPDGTGWTTSDRLLTAAEARNRRPWHSAWGRAAFGLDYHVAPAPNGGTYVFSWALYARLHDAHTRLLWWLLALILVVVFIAYVVMRRALRPVRWLGDGVARLGEGELDVVLPIRTRDEFGVLTDAFNRMVRRVRDMVRARDQLLLDVSHELRSPLTRLKVALALLPDDGSRARMEEDVSEMEVMIGELLELERLRDGRSIKTARQDLVPLLRDVAARIGDRAPGVRIASPARALFAEIDSEKMRMVLRNVLENAIKYSLPDSRPVEIVAMQQDDHIVVRVRDDGPGVPEGDLASLFEPFFRVDRSRSRKTGGYGLGLSICKRIMEAHGGEIAVENNPGRGATFTLTLRAAALSAADAAESTAEPDEPTARANAGSRRRAR